MKAEDYFVGPGIDIMHMTALQPGELLTTLRIPGTWAGAQFYFEKVRDRNVWDFPLVNVASAMKFSGTTIQQARTAVGAVAARPLRLTAVEAADPREFFLVIDASGATWKVSLEEGLRALAPSPLSD